MKKITSLLLASAMMISAFSTTVLAEESDLGVLTYDEIIAPEYEEVRGFNDGLAAVKKDGKWGYVDTENEVVVDFEYDYASSFNEGVGLVALKERLSYMYSWSDAQFESDFYTYGIVDAEGNFTQIVNDDGVAILSSDYILEGRGDAFFFNGYTLGISTVEIVDGVLFENMNTAMVSTDGTVTDIGYNVVTSRLNEGYFVGYDEDRLSLYDSEFNVVKNISEEIYKTGYMASSAYAVNQGILPVVAADLDTWEFYLGFWNVSANKWAVYPKYTNFWYSGVDTSNEFFGDLGTAIVSYDYGESFGMINKNGVTDVAFNYETIASYNEGYAVFSKDGKYGFLNENQKVALAPQYDQLTSLNGGIAVAVLDDKAFLIDRYGNELEGSEHVDTSAYFKTLDDGTTVVYSPTKYVVIEENGLYGFGEISYVPNLPLVSEMNSWAYDEVCAAIETGLVPVSLQNMYKKDITRGEFAHLITETLTGITGQSVDELLVEYTGTTAITNDYVDTTSYYVSVASALGIVNGKGNGYYKPYDTISREEAATMLARAAVLLGHTLPTELGLGVDDDSKVSNWAYESVVYVMEEGIMNGTGGNMFSPSKTYTREQSYMTVLRLLSAVAEG